jgi:hypothetical protein
MARKKIWRVLIGCCIGAPQRRKQSGSRTIREPTWYFQSKLLVSYNRKDNMVNITCQDFEDRNLIGIWRYVVML